MNHLIQLIGLSAVTLLWVGCPDRQPAGDDDDGPPGPQDDDSDDDDTGDDDSAATGVYCYQEDIDPAANLSDLDLDYDAGAWLDTTLAALHRRYPEGQAFVEEIQDDPAFAEAVDPSSFGALMASLPDAFRGETLAWNAEHGHPGADQAYWVNSAWQPRVPLYEGFPRADLVAQLPDETTALYRDTYLTGDAGEGDLLALLDDLDAQIARLSMASTVGDNIVDDRDLRDEALALMLFVQLYLGVARADHPDYYSEIHTEQVLLDLVTILWLKLQYFLDASAAYDQLGIDEDPIADHVAAEPNMGQLEQFVGLELEASPCLPEGQSFSPPF